MLETILSRLVEFLFGNLFKGWTQKKALSRQLESHKRNILHTQLMHNYPVELNKLRAFLIDSNLVDKSPFKEFFERWLADPIIELGSAVSGKFSVEQISELHKEVTHLKM